MPCQPELSCWRVAVAKRSQGASLSPFGSGGSPKKAAPKGRRPIIIILAADAPSSHDKTTIRPAPDDPLAVTNVRPHRWRYSTASKSLTAPVLRLFTGMAIAGAPAEARRCNAGGED
jgi:hypothetical protein